MRTTCRAPAVRWKTMPVPVFQGPRTKSDLVRLRPPRREPQRQKAMAVDEALMAIECPLRSRSRHFRQSAMTAAGWCDQAAAARSQLISTVIPVAVVVKTASSVKLRISGSPRPCNSPGTGTGCQRLGR